jgi:hypothetical protein
MQYVNSLAFMLAMLLISTLVSQFIFHRKIDEFIFHDKELIKQLLREIKRDEYLTTLVRIYESMIADRRVVGDDEIMEQRDKLLCYVFDKYPTYINK